MKPITSVFFDSVVSYNETEKKWEYDRANNASTMREVFKALLGDGIYPNPSTNLQVIAKSGMTVSVLPGLTWIQGSFGHNPANLDFQLDNGGQMDRIDRIVARMDLSFNVRNIVIEVKKGAEGIKPIAPVLQRDSAAWELALADIRVIKGSSTISQSAITDTRYNGALCGVVTGVVKQVDTTTLYDQVQDDLSHFRNDTQGEYNSWTAEKKAAYDLYIALRIARWDQFDESFKQSNIADFEQWHINFKAYYETDVKTWFDNLKTTVDSDPASNLYNMIDTHQNNKITNDDGVHGMRIKSNRLQLETTTGWAMTNVEIITGMTMEYFNSLNLSVTQFNGLNWTVEDFNKNIMIEE